MAFLDESNAPTAGKLGLEVDALRDAYIRFYVVHAADAPEVDVTFSQRSKPLRNSTAIDNLGNGEQDSVTLSGDVWKTRIFAAQDSPKIVGPLKLKPSGGAVYVVYAVGTLSGGTFDLLVQAIPTS